ncbi:MAG: tetratricopeptide repeat protein, partial [Candidatus Cloacimonetes bacterium]|nr:tetratricopeptide repeat protein [Candidatus Cloacimonadota bacterium]
MSKRLLPAGLVLGLLIVSCGLNNTMYNARKYFRSAQARPLNSNGKPTPQAIDEYTKTIQKCGVIITERKGSKIIDDALFLLARALYYKGNSAFQAKDQFEALIKGFPQSPHYPEAHIYLARVLRQINQPQEAEKLLESFVRDTRYLKFHPRALMVLAEFEIGDKDYLRAQYWLQRIITDYPGTPEFKEAYFLFGKNYYEQKDFAASLTEFERLVETRGISKELKLEGRYYIALNHFELGDLERSGKIIAALINDESRPDKLGQIRVLKARLLLAGADPQAGITEVDDLAKIYPRSMSSAAAYYYLGDHYFYRDGNIDQASTAYNKVRTEFPSSELVTASQAKVAALNQLKQNQSLSVTGNLQQFVDYHMLAADNYVNAFALPDSALMMYDRILQAAGPVRSKLDSLSIEALALQARADSLQIGITELETAL